MSDRMIQFQELLGQITLDRLIMITGVEERFGINNLNRGFTIDLRMNGKDYRLGFVVPEDESETSIAIRFLEYISAGLSLPKPKKKGGSDGGKRTD